MKGNRYGQQGLDMDVIYIQDMKGKESGYNQMQVDKKLMNVKEIGQRCTKGNNSG